MPFRWKKTAEAEKAFVGEGHHDFERLSTEMAPRSPDSVAWSSSSRESSASFQPMLPKPRSSRLGAGSRYRYPRINRTSLFICLTFTSIFTILFVTLTRMSVISSRQLEIAAARMRLVPAWEAFPFLKRYYGGVRSLVPRYESVPEYPADTDDGVPIHNASVTSPFDHRDVPMRSSVFDPYPDYTSAEYLSEYHAVVDCMAIAANTSLGRVIPAVRSYAGVTRGYPEPVMGSYEVLGLRDDVCFDRFGRLGPYGYGYQMHEGGTGAGLRGDREGIEANWAEQGPADFRDVRWGDLQERCVRANAHRFRMQPEHGKRCWVPGCDRGVETSAVPQGHNEPRGFDVTEDPGTLESREPMSGTNSSAETFGKTALPRTAFVLRTWSNFTYTTESIMFLRALVSELSLLSGGEYAVHLLVHVKDNDLPIWADDDLYQETLRKAVPEEFWDMVTLWTERQMDLIYSGLEETGFKGVPVTGAYRGLFMPLQWFARRNPEYEYFWHWEMDARYTGHYYHFLDRVSRWAREQPRKGLWERSDHFYIPRVHGTWEDFRQMVRVQTEMDVDNVLSDEGESAISLARGDWEAAKGSWEKPIWGPKKPVGDNISEFDIFPPTTYERDRYQWGVGEEADLITFNPLFDPVGTEWTLRDDVTGYNQTGNELPRRACINTVSRLSARLLRTMHHDNSVGRRSLGTEMWPASVALHHGLKAVAIPHPIYVDREWPLSKLASTFNGGRNGATGGASTSVFGGPKEHNFRGMSWYYNAGFASNLYRRWLGFRVDNSGGEQAELAGEGRMCMPGTLLHPIKEVGMNIEGE